MVATQQGSQVAVSSPAPCLCPLWEAAAPSAQARQTGKGIRSQALVGPSSLPSPPVSKGKKTAGAFSPQCAPRTPFCCLAWSHKK